MQIDPKTSLAGRSTGYRPNDTRPYFLGFFGDNLAMFHYIWNQKSLDAPTDPIKIIDARLPKDMGARFQAVD